MGFKHYGVDTGGIPVEYIKRFTQAFNIPVFIETGTAGGESVRAVAPLFKECHSIEIVEGRPDGEFPDNVKLYTGDSAKMLKEISEPHKNKNVFYWLDAHWSEPHEAPENVNECPILDEIQAIAGNKGVIMIDDARLFYGPPPWPCDPTKWPRFMHVFSKLVDCFPNNVTTIVDDYIISFPQEMRDVFRDEWRERYNLRYPTDEQVIKNCVSITYKAFLKYVN